VAKLSSNDPQTAYNIYSRMLEELGATSKHHNLTVFGNIMYLLPRSKEKFSVNGEEFSVNALGAVHMVLARSLEQVNSLKLQLGLDPRSSDCDSFWVGQW
ncbi:hypothetical protein L0F63_004521, partial [Massospora cicadina]